MQFGFTLLEVGASRLKHSRTVLFKNLVDTFVTIIAFGLIGYEISQGLQGGFIGTFSTSTENYYAKWSKALSFCNTSTTIVSGAMADRTFNDTYIFSTFLMATLVYPLASGWAWGDGWLQRAGFKDHAGSGVVHMLGGVVGFIAASIIGPRLGLYKHQTDDKFRFGRAEIEQ